MKRCMTILLTAVITSALVQVASAQQGELKLKITDKAGTEVVITGIDFDYSNYPGGFGTYTPDHEGQGIRVKQGQAVVTVQWRKVLSVNLLAEPVYSVQKECSGAVQQFSAADTAQWEAAKKGACRSWQRYKYSGRFQMVSGTSLSAEVVATSRDVKGSSELGVYSIALEDIKEIRPIR